MRSVWEEIDFREGFQTLCGQSYFGIDDRFALFYLLSFNYHLSAIIHSESF